MSVAGVLTIIGGFTAIYYLLTLAWRCWCGFRQFFLSEVWHMDLRTFGQWAVVTGATSGIGRAYAIEVAQRGMDVVLISRCEDKLRMIAKEIEDQYGRKTRTIQVDFTESQNIYLAMAGELQGLDIGLLVNNVGMTYSDHFAYFLEEPDAEQKITQIINCNMLSAIQMTRLVLPGMVERGTGLIINISSEVGIRPQPLLSLYSATKGFIIHFSQSLHAEYKSKGISIQCVTPCMVSTNMTQNLAPSCFIKTASGFAHDALNTVGHSNYTSGCLSHALQNVALTLLLPDWIRMSPFFLRKLRKIPKYSQFDKHLFRKKESQKEE